MVTFNHFYNFKNFINNSCNCITNTMWIICTSFCWRLQKQFLLNTCLGAGIGRLFGEITKSFAFWLDMPSILPKTIIPAGIIK